MPNYGFDIPDLPLVQLRLDLIGHAARLRTTMGEIPPEALTSGEMSAITDALAHLDDAQQALGERLRNPSWRYFLVLTAKEFQTLLWMGHRGYEAGLVESADVVYGSLPDDEEPNQLHPGLITLCYHEHNVSQVQHRIDDDPDAWGAGAPRALLSKLQAFRDEIN